MEAKLNTAGVNSWFADREWPPPETLPASTNALQFGPLRGVFDEPALRFQFLANGVGALEVPRLFGGGAGLEEAEDFRGRFLCGPVTDPQDAIQLCPGSKVSRGQFRGDLTRGQGPVDGPDPIEH